MDFTFSIKDLNNIRGEGLPENGQICFLIWEDADENYNVFVGCYNAEKEFFFADYGFGVKTIKVEDVLAWKPFDEENVCIKRIII